MKKALEEDSTVYDYDTVYDEIQRQRLDNSKKVLSGADRKVVRSLKPTRFVLFFCLYSIQ